MRNNPLIIEDIQNLGQQIKAGLAPVLIVGHRAYWYSGKTKISCLNTPEHCQALGERLVKAKNFTIVHSKNNIPNSHTLPKKNPFSWTVATNLLTDDMTSEEECIENYKEYLSLYNLTPAYANNLQGTKETLILVDIKPYPHSVPGFPDLVECKLVTVIPGKSKKVDHQITHLKTGLFVTLIKDFERVTSLSPEVVQKVIKRMESFPVLNPSVGTSTPGKFKHLLYYPGQSASIVNKDL